jgi:RNA polymerase sigma factor (sigma-70 family)
MAGLSPNSEQDFRPSGNYSDVMSDWSRSPGRAAGGHEWSVRLAAHARWLRTVIAARSGDVSAVEEIYQEIALAVVKQDANVPADKVAPWLYRLAVRQALLHRRRLGRQRRLRRNFAMQRPTDADGSADPLAWLLSDERQQLIRRAIGHLHAKDAELLLLKYTEDWSYRDLAAHLGISHSAVETRLHRARQRLRAELLALEVIEATS